MTADEYFGDWAKVIDKEELYWVTKWLKTVDSSCLCPDLPNVFKAFKVCPFKKLRAIALGFDPYPQKGVATGILFGNSKDTLESQLSPSLKVIKECAINYELPHDNIVFDNTLESWAKQGMLMINSAFTCEVNKVGWHTNIWQPFTSKLIENISKYDNGFVFLLFGKQAQSFKTNIKGVHKIIEVQHPSYFARINQKMPYWVFTEVNKYLKEQYNEIIEFYTTL